MWCDCLGSHFSAELHISLRARFVVIRTVSKTRAEVMHLRLLKASLCALLVLALLDRLSGADSSTNAEPSLKSIYAGFHTLDELKTADIKAIVCAFLDTECPIAQSYIPRLTD